MADTYPDVIPMIAYENGVAALEWLTRAFGFRERDRMLGPDGSLSHGEMEAGEGVIMLATPTPDYVGPKRHREQCEPARRWSAVPYIIDGVLVYVEDVDAHCAQARRAGAHPLRAGGHTLRPALSGGRPGRAPLDVRPARMKPTATVSASL